MPFTFIDDPNHPTNMLEREFGRLTVVEYVGVDEDNNTLYHALCACVPRLVRNVKGKYLRAGRVKSCGCLKKEAATAARKFKASLRSQQGAPA